MSGELARPSPTLPDLHHTTLPALDTLTRTLGVSRDVLASDTSITHVWTSLPRLLEKIPPEKRNILHVRMCVAVVTGLFDSAINYAWNSAVLELRDKIRRFGISIVHQFIQREFSEELLVDLKDAELLDLCLKLNLITQEDFFFLSQCRELRNSFSAAHPPPSALDEDEITSFISRIGRHALADRHDPRGVDMKDFIASVKGGEFSPDQLAEWVNRVEATHDVQRVLVFETLHGIYCDPSSNEESRQNAFVLCEGFQDEFTTDSQSALINRHSDYVAKGLDDKLAASRLFFEKLGMIDLLGEHEVHRSVSHATQDLLSVHNAINNFYNEPNVARRLEEVTNGVAVPRSTQREYVHAVLTCAIGNPYGVSYAALPHYKNMIKNFSPQEIAIMLDSPSQNETIKRRVTEHPRCERRFRDLVSLINSNSVPISSRSKYDRWLPSNEDA